MENPDLELSDTLLVWQVLIRDLVFSFHSWRLTKHTV